MPDQARRSRPVDFNDDPRHAAPRSFAPSPCPMTLRSGGPIPLRTGRRSHAPSRTMVPNGRSPPKRYEISPLPGAHPRGLPHAHHHVPSLPSATERGSCSGYPSRIKRVLYDDARRPRLAISTVRNSRNARTRRAPRGAASRSPPCPRARLVTPVTDGPWLMKLYGSGSLSAEIRDDVA
jgi:hypothetical protein